jgi:putative ABC transport system permease protein
VHTPPYIPGLIVRALDLIHPDAVVGDLLEEYVTFVRPTHGPFRARLWFWRHLFVTLIVGLARTALHRRVPKRAIGSYSQRRVARSESMFTLLNDVRYSLRMLLKTPGLSLTAIMTIALGIGLTTHTFSVVYGSVIRGLPFEDGDRVIHVSQNNLADGINGMGIRIHDFVDLREQQTAFDDLAAFYQGTVNLADAEARPERYQGGFVTAGMFRLLGVQAVVGRLFQDEEDYGRDAPTVVLGNDVWRTRYGSDPAVVGRTIRVNGRGATVVGVLPAGFRFPFDEDVYVPLGIDPARLERGGGFRLDVIGRLADGVTVDEASVQMSALANRLAVEYPETNEGVGMVLEEFVSWQMPPQIVAVLYVMLAAVFGVLLIACANVANLLLARAAVRIKEVAIRSALGASRGRVIRQLLVESAVVAVIGGVLGVALSYVGLEIFNAAIVDVEKPYWISIELAPPVLFFALAVTVVSALISGTVPALKASGADVHDILKDESRGASSFRMGRFSSALVVGEIAISCGLLIGAGFMVKSIINLKGLDLGFTPDHVFTSRVGLFEADYPQPEQRRQFFDELVPRLEAIPGVRSVALATALPAAGTGNWWFGVEGATYDREQDYPFAHRADVTPGFFGTFEIPVVEGRDFTPQDREGSLPVAIVNQSFARRFFPETSALGKRIRLGRSDSENPWLTIVGVVADAHVGGGVGGIGSDRVRPESIYTAVGQNDDRFLSIAIKTAGPPLAITDRVRDAVASLDANLPIYQALTMEDVIESSTWAFGVFGSLFAIFGVIALFMASVGLYGVMAFSVSRRVQELGIRMALGAHAKNIVGLVLKRGLVQLGIGITGGLALGALLARPLRVVLFDVSTGDASVYLAIVVTLAFAGLLACIIPARRATRVDLVEALKPE